MIEKLEQHHVEALVRWISVHEKEWKEELRNAWFCGKYRGLIPGRESDEVTLQNLRFKIGPAGLDKLTKKSVLEKAEELSQ